jgi:hypothetical protein
MRNRTDRECVLQRALDGHERCPGDACPFWSGGDCQLNSLEIDLDTNPELAQFFLEMRGRLTQGEGWRPFRRVAAPGGR